MAARRPRGVAVMKYYATIDNQTYEVCIEGEDITIDGEAVEADMQHLTYGNLYSLLLNHASHEIEVEANPRERGEYGVLIEGARYAVKVQDERTRRLVPAERRAQAAAGETTIRAPIPGLVVKVLVAPGQQVAEGQPLLILEAMKMENDLRAPHAGTVHEIRVEPGAQVALGQALALLKVEA